MRKRDDYDDLCCALRRMRKICKIIRKCFAVATAILSIGWAIVVMALLANWINSGANMAGSVLYAVVFGALCIMILWNLTQLFGEVDKGEKQFSEQQAERLQTIAVIALAIVVLDALMSFGFMFQPIPELGFGMVVNDGIAEPTLNLNVGMLAFSAIMYSLSAIFRYAALLQQLSDETV